MPSKKRPLSPEEQLRDDFCLFLKAIWKHLGLPPPDPIQLNMAYTMQYGPPRLVIEAFRGVGKSYIAGAFCVWLLFRNPDLSILVLSASVDKASDQTQFMLRLVNEIPLLMHLSPRDSARSSMLAFDVAGAKAKQSPSVRSKGITSTITGGRADIILADDVETPDNSATQTMREKIREKVRELDNIIKPDPGARILYLGTPQLEDTLYGVLPERGYHVRVWPIRYPTAAEKARYGTNLAPKLFAELEADPTLAGKPTEGRRFNESIIAEKELTQGRTGFALQYMLGASLSDADKHPLKLRDLSVFDLNPERAPEKVIWATSPELLLNDLPNVGLKGDKLYRPMGYEGMRDPDGRVIWQPYTGAVMAIDPAGRGSDEVGYAVTKMLNSTIFVPAAGGLRGGHDMDTLQELALIAKTNQVKRIIVEANFGDGMWTKLFQPVLQQIYPCTTEDVKASNTLFKEARIIDVLEPVMSQHRLVFDPKVIQQDFETAREWYSAEKYLSYMLVYQLTRITRVRHSLIHDDRLDALSWAVWYWLQHMSGDQATKLQATKDRWMEAQIEKHLEACLGYEPQQQGWM